MNNRLRFYLSTLYPFQDGILQIIQKAETPFYLTGGTAASRAYLNHRFSEDLDFFVNDDDSFPLWSQRVIQTLLRTYKVEVLQREERFVRLDVRQGGLAIKVEMINDVPAHVGEIRLHPTLGRIDSPENILANKITALVSREEPKDLADVWGFCTQMGLSLSTAITEAQSKAAGIFPPDLARRLCSVQKTDWEAVLWINPPAWEMYQSQLIRLGESLIIIK